MSAQVEFGLSLRDPLWLLLLALVPIVGILRLRRQRCRSQQVACLLGACRIG